MQSRILVILVGSLLMAESFPLIGLALLTGRNAGHDCRIALGVSLAFGLLVWLLRAATWPAAVFGSAICLIVSVGFQTGRSFFLSGLTPLIALFVMTNLATRVARAKNVSSDAEERRTGRKASQVIANLGWAGLVALVQFLPVHPVLTAHGFASGGLLYSRVFLVAVLAEATADTVASELGQAFGGIPRMVGSWRPVGPGTDGAVTLTGSLSGVLGAMLIAVVSMPALRLSYGLAGIALLAAVGGFFVDTMLGATVERKGRLGNDLVNFLSNGSAALFAFVLLVFHP